MKVEMLLVQPDVLCNSHFQPSKEYLPNLKCLVFFFDFGTSWGHSQGTSEDFGPAILLPYFETLAGCAPRAEEIAFDMRLLQDVDEREFEEDGLKVVDILTALEKAFLRIIPKAPSTLPSAKSVFVGRELAAAELLQSRAQIIKDLIKDTQNPDGKAIVPQGNYWKVKLDAFGDEYDHDDSQNEDDDSEDDEQREEWDAEKNIAEMVTVNMLRRLEWPNYWSQLTDGIFF